MKSWACFFGLHDWVDFQWDRLETWDWAGDHRYFDYRANSICSICEKLDMALDRARAYLVEHEAEIAAANAERTLREQKAKERATYLLSFKEKAKAR